MYVGGVCSERKKLLKAILNSQLQTSAKRPQDYNPERDAYNSIINNTQMYFVEHFPKTNLMKSFKAEGEGAIYNTRPLICIAKYYK